MANYERVKYKKCPLVEVTYQLNFPTILSIESESPATFQEGIRREIYPYFDVKHERQNEVTFNITNPNSNPVLYSKDGRKLYSFVSEDYKWRILLSKDMIAISTIEYSYWEDMYSRVSSVVKTLNEVYHPVYYTRIGLRYIDVFDRITLGLKDTPWDSLVNSHLCGCLGYKNEEAMIVRRSLVSSEIVFDKVFVNIASGTGMVDRHDGGSPKEAFILNCDYFYNEKTTSEKLDCISNFIHDRSHRFFRDSITEKLHLAMEPEKI